MTIITETEIIKAKYTLALATDNVDAGLRESVKVSIVDDNDYVSLLGIFLEDARRRASEGEVRSEITRKLEQEYTDLNLEDYPSFNDIQPLVIFAASYRSFRSGDGVKRLNIIKSLADAAGFIPISELRDGLWLYILRAIVWGGLITTDKTFTAQAIEAASSISGDDTALLPECLVKWLQEGDAS